MSRDRHPGGNAVIEMRRLQLSFGEGLIAEEVSDLREEWMTHADEILVSGAPTASCFHRQVGWSDKPSASRRRSPRVSSGRAISWDSWRWMRYASTSTRWCRRSGR